MSDQIEVHKWAVRFRGHPCCGVNVVPMAAALPFIVTEIRPSSEDLRCNYCEAFFPAGELFVYGADGGRFPGMMISTVKRLLDPPPLEEPREVEVPRPEALPA